MVGGGGIPGRGWGVLPVAERVAGLSIRAFARRAVAREVGVTVEGLERVPTRGPLVLAARHVHHLHDATVLMTLLPRQMHFLVALDWVRAAWGRRVMEAACRMARWPTVLRRDSPHLLGPHPDSAYRLAEWHGLMRQAIADSTALMRDERVLVVFPEGYPDIDPEHSLRSAPHDVLPFRPGFAKIVERAQRAIGRPVPIVPVGFHYVRLGARWQVVVRFGSPAYIACRADIPAFVREIERQVRALSGE